MNRTRSGVTTLIIMILTLVFYSTVGFSQTPTFLSNFEDRNTKAKIGKEHIELYSGDTMYVVANPHPDVRNNSNYVIKLCAHQSSRSRAEYDAWRNETNEKTYFYTWKRYHPIGMFRDINMRWGAMNQWKTWPCEVYGSGEYEKYDSLISYWDDGGIFNETRLSDTTEYVYLSRAEPCRRADYYTLQEGYWNSFILEIYWTNTENGYYRLWKNDTLIAYSDHIKTLFDEFLEGTCDMYWSTGLYVSWTKTGAESQDTLIAYIDDIAIYDADSSYVIDDICPNCEVAPAVPISDSSVYKINLYGEFAPDGYNNYVLRWNRKPYMYNLSNTWGQSSDIDIFIPDVEGNEGSSHSDECFPDDVINSYINWYDANTRLIELKGLNPANTYKIKMLSAGKVANQGLQVWTTEGNRDTVFSSGNTCDMAELKNLIPDENGDLTIYMSATNSGYPRPYLNAIEITEYVNTVSIDKLASELPDRFHLSQNYPNPFNPSTMINYQLPMNNMVTLKIFDVLGREVITLVNEQKPAGTYTVQWNGTNSAGVQVGSGIYFYQLKTSNGFLETKKMLLLK